MNSIDRQLARSPTRGLQKALMALGIALAALVSAIVLVLNPQPFPYPSQVPLACSVVDTHGSPKVAMVRDVSPVSRRTDEVADARCA
ncbi:hypothetical protein [Variovorax sp. J31P207]|uniref:hypothetical protein n=1 Tax=Variovorax sp. J31P207 TaxID=3053510 RepID=UPI002574C7ED|nr:hypothetical protein [Variovorax sp. J31P207]MDM0066421.1 hypothetical protein [Variovorax sp. J31P207]